VKVLRIEKPDGMGPYMEVTDWLRHASPKAQTWWRATWADERYHPHGSSVPGWSMLMPKEQLDYHFGFLDEEQMRAWFPPVYREALAKEGYVLNEYVVPRLYVLWSDKQAAFKVDEAKLVETRSIA
jgi:hypothetical protein